MARIEKPVDKKYLFISGPPRAGTTLLRLVLSTHPEITITPETHFIQQLLDFGFDPHGELNQTHREHLLKLINDDVKLQSWPMFSASEYQQFARTTKPLTVYQLLDTLFVSFSQNIDSGIQYLGNKKGMYAEGYARYVRRIFPGAKFIFIVRDPRDVARSIQSSFDNFGMLDGAYTCAMRSIFINRIQKKIPDDVLVVRYEDLVMEPETISQSICDFLDLPLYEQMVRFYEQNPDGSMLIGVTKDIHQHTTVPFNPDLIDQWKKSQYYTKKELQKIETITLGYMKKFGYVPETNVRKIWAALCRLKVLGKIYWKAFIRLIHNYQSPRYWIK